MSSCGEASLFFFGNDLTELGEFFLVTFLGERDMDFTLKLESVLLLYSI
jgi:hypothetical protein